MTAKITKRLLYIATSRIVPTSSAEAMDDPIATMQEGRRMRDEDAHYNANVQILNIAKTHWSEYYHNQSYERRCRTIKDSGPGVSLPTRKKALYSLSGSRSILSGVHVFSGSVDVLNASAFLKYRLDKSVQYLKENHTYFTHTEEWFMKNGSLFTKTEEDQTMAEFLQGKLGSSLLLYVNIVTIISVYSPLQRNLYNNSCLLRRRRTESSCSRTTTRWSLRRMNILRQHARWDRVLVICSVVTAHDHEKKHNSLEHMDCLWYPSIKKILVITYHHRWYLLCNMWLTC